VNERRAFFRELASVAREARRATRPDEPAPEPDAVARPADDPSRLTDAERERYARQLSAWGDAAQLALREASAIVVGAGALGSPVAAYLAAAGVGRLGIVDEAAVAPADLAGQPLHYTPDLGVAKTESAAAKLRFLNPEVVVEPYRVRFDETTAAGLVDGQDLVVDCSDAPYAVNAACCAAGVPLVTGGAGVVMAIRPGETACLRCAFPDALPERADALGPAAGAIGSLMAMDALKLLTGVDIAGPDFPRVTVARRVGCPDCGGRTL
jgi:molybdopterin/thiamine biosynthesis adenylyltransferase